MSTYVEVEHKLLLGSQRPYVYLISMINQNFQAAAMSVQLFSYTTWTLTKHLNGKLNWNCIRMLHAVPDSSTQKTANVWPLTPPHTPPHLANHPSNKTCWALLKKQGRTHKWHSPMDSYTWTHQYWPTNKNLCEHWVQCKGLAKSNDL